jgi:hypothetical protein
MQPFNPQERPYRSHLRPACNPCRRRKSRCKIETHSPPCLMCRVHGTECSFPGDGGLSTSQATPRAQRSPRQRRPLSSRSVPCTSSPLTPGELRAPANVADESAPPINHSNANAWAVNEANVQEICQPTPLSIDDAAQENPHIVGPANTNDSQVLADYLSIISHSNGGIRMIRPVPSSRSKPVLFASVQKRPLGMDFVSNPSREKLRIIEKLLEPCVGKLVDLWV